MKCFRYCCCLLCALVLLSTVFSINAHAKESVTDYRVSHTVDVLDSNGNVLKNYYYSFNSNEDDKYYIANNDVLTANGWYRGLRTKYKITTDNIPLIEKGGKVDLTLHNAYYSYGFTTQSTGSFWYYRHLHDIRLLLTFTGGTQKYIDDVDYTQDGAMLTITSSFVPDKDVDSVEFIIDTHYTPTGDNWYVSFYLGNVAADRTDQFVLSFKQQSEESGLLGNILDWVKGIFNSIAELPSKLWNLISDGLKSLFVPDEQFIVQYKEDMDSMLSEKLGAVYQVIDITLESWDRISASDEQNTINLPETTINLPENNKFSFGGYDVKIVPDGFDVLANAIKLIGGICVTILFVNGLRKRYDEVMGVEK